MLWPSTMSGPRSLTSSRRSVERGSSAMPGWARCKDQCLHGRNAMHTAQSRCSALQGHKLRTCTVLNVWLLLSQVSGSPWSISLAWPETADNCGRAVPDDLGDPGMQSFTSGKPACTTPRSSYRVYRDGSLISPLSNEFHGDPMLVGAISKGHGAFGKRLTKVPLIDCQGSDSITLSITAKESGSAWATWIALGWSGLRAGGQLCYLRQSLCRTMFAPQVRLRPASYPCQTLPDLARPCQCVSTTSRRICIWLSVDM